MTFLTTIPGFILSMAFYYFNLGSFYEEVESSIIVIYISPTIFRFGTKRVISAGLLTDMIPELLFFMLPMKVKQNTNE